MRNNLINLAIVVAIIAGIAYFANTGINVSGGIKLPGGFQGNIEVKK